jgi:hypothetical protein
MKNLMISGSKYAPDINFDCENNVLSIKGVSFPEDTKAVYAPVFPWLDEYFKAVTDQEILIEFHYEYFNSSTMIFLTSIFELLEKEYNQGKEIIFNWYYAKDDDEMEEYGEDFQEDFPDLPINLLEEK